MSLGWCTITFFADCQSADYFGGTSYKRGIWDSSLDADKGGKY